MVVRDTIHSQAAVFRNEALGLMFLYLKLTDQIDWSWWWVTSPFWISLSMLIAVHAIAELKKK